MAELLISHVTNEQLPRQVQDTEGNLLSMTIYQVYKCWYSGFWLTEYYIFVFREVSRSSSTLTQLGGHLIGKR